MNRNCQRERRAGMRRIREVKGLSPENHSFSQGQRKRSILASRGRAMTFLYVSIRIFESVTNC